MSFIIYTFQLGTQIPRNVGISVKRIQVNSYGKKMCKKSPVGRGAGGTPLYKPYKYVPPTGRVLSPFWSENAYIFCSFWPGIGYGFQGNYRECVNVFIVSIQNE